MLSDAPAFHAIVLAGERGPVSALAEYAGVCCKALADVDGSPMVVRVLDTLMRTAPISRIVLSASAQERMAGASPGLRALLDAGEVHWIEAAATPSQSVVEAMHEIAEDIPVLVTTGDHPLLTPAIVDEFIARVCAVNADVCVGLAHYPLVHEAFPDMKKTVLRFGDGGYCGCNLFAFATPASRTAASFWRRVEKERKRPWRLIRMLGWTGVLRYVTFGIPLDRVAVLASSRLGMKVAFIVLPHAEAAVDVDSVDDLLQVRARLARQRGL